MKIGTPSNANATFRGNGDNVKDLKTHVTVHNDACEITSLWYPTERERLHILAGLPIQLHMLIPEGSGMPPAKLTVSSHTTEVTAGIDP